MVVVNLEDKARSLEIRGKYGAPCGLGELYLGWSRVGELDEKSGIYQKRPRKSGQIFVRMKHYIMNNPRTVNQQAQRTKMANAILAWRGLSFDEQISWNRKNFPAHMSGYNRFLRDFLRS